MKAYKVEVLVLDFEGYGKEEIENLLEYQEAMLFIPIEIEERDIGEWSDDHPLNSSRTREKKKKKLFAEESE